MGPPLWCMWICIALYVKLLHRSMMDFRNHRFERLQCALPYAMWRACPFTEHGLLLSIVCVARP